jgi:glycosyltransferase involved in cell wall biosynthesis
MERTPLISIIIPVYNREFILAETLQSIILQSYSNWECVLVDDGSTDGTMALMQKYKDIDLRIKTLKRPSNLLKGANSCRNYGFSASEGEYINWFDSDDVMHPNFLKNKIFFFLNNEHVNCVISKTQFFIGHISKIIGQEKRTFNSQNLLEDFIQLKRSWYTWDPMWRKSWLKNKLLFSEDLLKGQDRDFHIRMLQHTDIKICFLDEYLAYYRQHKNTISNNFSKEVAHSVHYMLKQRIIKLKKYEVSDKTLMFVYIELFKNYRYLRSNSRDILKFMLKNPLNHKLYYKWLVKFLIASISYKLIGKGDFFLKE